MTRRRCAADLQVVVREAVFADEKSRFSLETRERLLKSQGNQTYKKLRGGGTISAGKGKTSAVDAQKPAPEATAGIEPAMKVLQTFATAVRDFPPDLRR